MIEGIRIVGCGTDMTFNYTYPALWQDFVFVDYPGPVFAFGTAILSLSAWPVP